MRYTPIILLTMLLSACGNKLGSLKYASEKVKQTVKVSTETIITACPATTNSSVRVDKPKTEGDNSTRPATSWDTHMMLW